MHSTSNTNISNAIQSLTIIDERLVDASFIPEEQLLAMCVAGTMLIGELMMCPPCMYTDDEVSYVSGMIERIDGAYTEFHCGDMNDAE